MIIVSSFFLHLVKKLKIGKLIYIKYGVYIYNIQIMEPKKGGNKYFYTKFYYKKEKLIYMKVFKVPLLKMASNI